MKTRICTDCRKTYPLDASSFHRVKSGFFYGFCYRCKSCERKRDIARYQKRKAHNYEYQKKYREQFPQKIAVRYQVRKALEEGKLIKTACVVCKNPKSYAHHADYSKPLDIVWYCGSHHQLAHQKENSHP